MSWTLLASGLSDVLSLALVIRIAMLGLHSAYRIFCAFLLFEVVSESFFLIERSTALDKLLDYRVTWLVVLTISWVLSIWMVYQLLRMILAKLPGVLRFSQRVLKIAFPLSVVVALLTAGPEYIASGAA